LDSPSALHSSSILTPPGSPFFELADQETFKADSFIMQESYVVTPSENSGHVVVPKAWIEKGK
jgi:hypothetical protein